jgi:hypothetical protein
MDPLFAWKASSTARWTIFIIIWIRLMYVHSNKNRNEKSGKKVLSCERQGKGSRRKNEYIRMMKSTIPSSVFQTVLMFFMLCFLLRVKPALYCLCIRKSPGATEQQSNMNWKLPSSSSFLYFILYSYLWLHCTIRKQSVLTSGLIFLSLYWTQNGAVMNLNKQRRNYF